jgi:hypothetical protein
MQLPHSLADSRLVREGGISVVRGLLSESILDELREDARSLAESARHFCFSGPNKEDWRGGEPSRAMAGKSAGPVHYRIFSSVPMAETISDICGFPVACSGAGSYSWYMEPGDHLALHRDIVACDVALVTCLERTGPNGGTLCVYPDYIWSPLRDIRPEGRVCIPLDPGDTAVLVGGMLPHEVTRTLAGQRRIVSINCFRLRGAGRGIL